MANKAHNANGMADKKEEVLTMMRHVARASTVEEYECRLEELQASLNWSLKESQHFRQWFSNTLLRKKEVNPVLFAYVTDEGHDVIETFF